MHSRCILAWFGVVRCTSWLDLWRGQAFVQHCADYDQVSAYGSTTALAAYAAPEAAE